MTPVARFLATGIRLAGVVTAMLLLRVLEPALRAWDRHTFPTNGDLK